jgi:hypothetical protein
MIQSVNSEDNYGASTGYDLHTPLLQTCRQINAEGSDVLYNQNVFVATCFSGDHGSYHDLFPICPITRSLSDWESDLSGVPGLLKVKKWKVILSAHCSHEDARCASIFPEFCRALVKHVPKSLDVGVLPKGIEADPVVATNYFRIEDVLVSLKLLRGVESLVI